jgi:hypothetical protein
LSGTSADESVAYSNFTPTVNWPGATTPSVTAPTTSTQYAALSSGLTFSSGNSNQITVADTGPSATTMTVFLSVAYGELTLNSGGMTGVTIAAGANDSSSMTLTGTALDINNALDGLTYTSSTVVADTLTLAVDDPYTQATDSGQAGATVTIQVLPTVTLSDDGPSSAVLGQFVGFTVNVSGGGSPVPTGTIEIEDASNSDAVVGSGTLVNGSVAIDIPSSSLGVGTHNLFSSYSGDGNYLATTSSSVSQAVTNPITVTNVVANGDTAPILSATESGTTVTITTDGASGFSSGDSVSIAGVGTGYNGVYTIGSVDTSDNTFTYTSGSSSLSTVNDHGAATTDQTTSGLLAGAQRSMVDSIVYAFNQQVTLGSGAFSIALHPDITVGSSTDQTRGTLPTLTWASPDGGTTWVVTFSGSGVAGGSIANGVYDITLNASDVSPNSGDATMGANQTDTFYRLFGALTGNATVNGTDLTLVENGFDKTSTESGFWTAFDLTDTGQINGTDLTLVENNFDLTYSNFTATINWPGATTPSLTAPTTTTQYATLSSGLTFSSGNSNQISVGDSGPSATQMTVFLGVQYGTLTLNSSGMTGVTIAAGANDSPSMTLTGTASAINAALNGLTYTTSTAVDDTLTIAVDDPYTEALDAGQHDASVNIHVMQPSVDAPSAAQDATLSGGLTFSSGGSNPITVADTGPANTTLTVTLSVVSGQLTLATTAGVTIAAGSNDTSSVTLTGTASALNVALDGLRYTTTSADDDTLSITVDDPATLAAGTNEADASVAIDVMQPSVSVPGAQIATPDASLIFSTGNAITVGDASSDNPPLTVTLSDNNGILTLGSTSGLTFLSGANGNTSMTFTGSASAINTALDGLTFNISTVKDDVLHVTVQDPATQFSGQDAASLQVPISVMQPLVAVQAASQGVDANVLLTFSPANANAIRVGDAGMDGPTLTVSLSCTHGVLSLATTAELTFLSGSSRSSSMTFTGPAANINLALDGLTYLTSGSASDTLQVRVDDPPTLAEARNQADASVSIGVMGPSVSVPPSTQLTEASAPLVFSAANHNALTVGDTGPADTPLTVSLSAANGTFSLAQTGGLSFADGSGVNDVSETFTGTASAVNAALNGLTYELASWGTDALAITVDDPGTLSAGQGQADASIAISAGPEVDVPSAQTANIGTPFVFSAANSNAITVADPGPADTSLSVVLSVANGALTLAQTSGLTFSSGTGVNDSRMAFSGDAVDVNAALDGLAYTIPSSGGADLLSVSVDDPDTLAAGAEQADASVSITSGPSVTVPPAQTQDPSTPLAFTSLGGNAIVVGDAGPSDTPLTVALSVANGTLTLATTNNLAFADDGTGTAESSMTFTGQAADINTALDGLTYSLDSGDNGQDTLNISVDDPDTIASGTNTATASVPIAIGTITFGALDDQTNNTGASVSVPVTATSSAGSVVYSAAGLPNGLSINSGTGLISGAISANAVADNNADDAFAPTITATSPDGLTASTTFNWTVNAAPPVVTSITPNVGVVNGALLTGSSQPQINGTAAAGSIVTLYQNGVDLGQEETDETGQWTFYYSELNQDVPLADGTYSFTVTATYNGVTSPASQAASITVDTTPPTVSLTTSGIQASLSPTVQVSATDANGVPNGTPVELDVESAAGVFEPYGSGTITNGTAVIALPAIPPGQYELQASVADIAGNVGTSAVESLGVVPPGTAVLAPNLVVPTAQTVSPGGTRVFSSAGSNAITVGDSDPTQSTLTVTIAAANGTVSLTDIDNLTFSNGSGTDDTSVTFSGAAADINTALDGLSYSPNAGFSGDDTLNISVDDANTLAAGQGGASANVTIVVAQPVGPNVSAPGSEAMNAGTTLTFSAANNDPITVSDSGAANTPLTVSLSVTSGTLTLPETNNLTFAPGSSSGAASMTFTGTAAAVNAALNGLGYVADDTDNDTLSISVDDPSTLSSGQGTATASVAITVNPGPSVTAPDSAPIAVATDGSLAFTGANLITVGDADPSLTLTVGLSVGNGTLTLASPGGLITAGANNSDRMTLTGSGAAINAALAGLTYTPSPGLIDDDTLNISVDDANTLVSGQGAATDSVALDVSLTGPVSGATLAIADPQTTVSDTPLVFSTANSNAFALADSNDPSLMVTLSVANGTLTLPATGGLTFLDGSANGQADLTIEGSPTNLNAALNGLTYTPNTHFSGDDALSITVSDPISAVEDIQVTATSIPASGPSVDVPEDQSTNVGTALVFSTADENPITVDDAGPGNTPMTVSLSVANGVLTLAGTSNLTFVPGSSNGAASMTFTGTADAVNAALNGLTYAPSAGFSGDDTLNVSVDDPTSVADGTTATAAIGISVTYPPPTLTVPNDMTVTSGATVTFQGSATSEIGIASISWLVSYNGEDFETDPNLPTVQEPSGTLSVNIAQNYTFTAYGDYEVLIEVTDVNGQTTENGFDVTVNEFAPTATVSYSGPTTAGSTVTFTVAELDPDTIDTVTIYADWQGTGLFEEVDQDQITNNGDGSISFFSTITTIVRPAATAIRRSFASRTTAASTPITRLASLSTAWPRRARSSPTSSSRPSPPPARMFGESSTAAIYSIPASTTSLIHPRRRRPCSNITGSSPIHSPATKQSTSPRTTPCRCPATKAAKPTMWKPTSPMATATHRSPNTSTWLSAAPRA